METASGKLKHSGNYSVMQAGNWQDLMQYKTEVPGGKAAQGKVFLEHTLTSQTITDGIPLDQKVEWK